MASDLPQPEHEAAHLDDFRAADLNEGADELGPDSVRDVDEEGQTIQPPAPPEQIDRAAFWVVFQTAFQMPGLMVPALAPVAIQTHEQEPGRAASDAVYSLLEIYYPRALVPGSETIGHVVVAAPFFIGKALIVREILRANRARPINHPEPPEAEAQERPASAQPSPSPGTGQFDNWVIEGSA